MYVIAFFLMQIRFLAILINILSWVGITVHLAEEVINNAIADLDPIDQGTRDLYSTANSKASTGALLQTRHRKRKHATTASGYSAEQLHKVNVEKEVSRCTTSVSVKIAALEALEALLTVVCFSFIVNDVVSWCT